MTPQQIKDTQEKFIFLQQQVQEEVSSPENDVKVAFNGNVQIVSLEIPCNKNIEEIKPVLIETINTGIKRVSERIKTIMMTLQAEMQHDVQ